MLDAMFQEPSASAGRTLIGIYERLQVVNARWLVEWGPRDGGGWLSGACLRDATQGPFATLLACIQARMDTQDRKVAAASFALRFGWSSAVAFAPYLAEGFVPDVRLENVSLRFTEGALFERVSLHEPRAWCGLHGAPPALDVLRAVLVAQTTPVVAALHHWSRLSPKALWGQVTSSWSAQFEPILSELGRADEALAAARSFFEAEGPAFESAPTLYVVEHCDVTRIHHRRSSCCLYYKVKDGSYCASCPLISQEERVTRNKAWIARTTESTS